LKTDDNVQGCFDMKLYVTKNAIEMTFEVKMED